MGPMGMGMEMGLRGLVQASPKRRHGGRPRRMRPRPRHTRLHLRPMRPRPRRMRPRPHFLAEKMGQERQMAQEVGPARVDKEKM